MSEAIRFSVVIPVKNDEKNIARCLGSLARLLPPSAPFEVIIVDNGSTDHTVAIAKSFCGTIPLIVLIRPDCFISALRNTGASLATGTWLAFLDSDCEVKADWLTRAETFATAGGVSVFGSFYLIPEESSWVARYWYGETERKPRGQTSFVPSGDLFFEKAVFDRIGGFNEKIQTNEDVEICQRVGAAGFPVVCFPELAVIHWGTPQSLGQFFRKNRWHGTHVFHVFIRNLPRLLNLKPLMLAFYTLLSSAMAVVCVILGLCQRNFIPFLISLVLLALPCLVLGVVSAIRTKRLAAIGPMSALFLVYALARASSLLHTRPKR
jgi:glycosyltransferase involved in cell wall biosynthesis